MITICLEGPSAVGKSSLSEALVAEGNALAIPEVNQLFLKPITPEPNWYLCRQQERWEMASRSSSKTSLAILDGDVLQPLWYGWAYRFSSHSSLSELVAFYRPLIASGELSFPDAYFVLECSAEELRARRLSDTARARRNFERHLEFIEPQRRYFQALKDLDPALVHWLPTGTISSITEEVRRLSPKQYRSKSGDLKVFDQLVKLLE